MQSPKYMQHRTRGPGKSASITWLYAGPSEQEAPTAKSVISKSTMRRWAAQTDDDERDRDCSERVARLLDEPPRPARKPLSNNDGRRGYAGSNAWELRRD